MMLILHIAIAFAGLGVAGLSLIHPNKRTISLSYGLLGLTLASGTILVIAEPAHMTTACMSGLGYTIFMLLVTSMSRRKLLKLVEERQS